ncbi:hypothetical protein TNCV_4141501 [Trichonephila clavipes]|nr:hypothetical protein TNCV_4141501 [Trichonephila clavipes]
MRIPYRDSNWHRRHRLMETALFPCNRSTAAFRVEMGLPKTAEGRQHETPSVNVQHNPTRTKIQSRPNLRWVDYLERDFASLHWMSMAKKEAGRKFLRRPIWAVTLLKKSEFEDIFYGINFAFEHSNGW